MMSHKGIDQVAIVDSLGNVAIRRYRVSIGRPDASEGRIFAEPTMSTRKVLVVEDDDSIRLVIAQLLRLEGYEVHSASTYEEALEVFHELESDLFLVCSDVGLPDGNGTDLMRQMLKMQPRLRILLMSGSLRDPDARLADRARRFAFLRKPFSLAEMRETVRTLAEDEPVPAIAFRTPAP